MKVQRALQLIQRFRPEVNSIIDAIKGEMIHVTEGNVRNGKRKDFLSCPISLGAKRCLGASDVLTFLSVIYVIHGKKATRYKINYFTRAADNIVSFDRNCGFLPGWYWLAPASEGARLGVEHKVRTNNPHPRRHPQYVFRTKGVRRVIGRK